MARNGMERKFCYEIWNMTEWIGRIKKWNRRQSSVLPYQFYIRSRALYLQKNIYKCMVVILINNIVTVVFNFNIYTYYLSTNCGTLVVYIAQTVYILNHSKYIVICSINVL